MTETATASQFTYVYHFLSEEDDLPPGFPPNFDNTDYHGVVYDAGAYNAWGGFEPSDPYNAADPTTTVTVITTAAPVVILQARSSDDLDLGVNMLPVMMDAQWRITPRVAVRFGAGPTLNVISTALKRRRSGLPAALALPLSKTPAAVCMSALELRCGLPLQSA